MLFRLLGFLISYALPIGAIFASSYETVDVGSKGQLGLMSLLAIAIIGFMFFRDLLNEIKQSDSKFVQEAYSGFLRIGWIGAFYWITSTIETRVASMSTVLMFLLICLSVGLIFNLIGVSRIQNRDARKAKKQEKAKQRKELKLPSNL